MVWWDVSSTLQCDTDEACKHVAHLLVRSRRDYPSAVWFYIRYSAAAVVVRSPLRIECGVRSV